MKHAEAHLAPFATTVAILPNLTISARSFSLSRPSRASSCRTPKCHERPGLVVQKERSQRHVKPAARAHRSTFTGEGQRRASPARQRTAAPGSAQLIAAAAGTAAIAGRSPRVNVRIISTPFDAGEAPARGGKPKFGIWFCRSCAPFIARGVWQVRVGSSVARHPARAHFGRDLSPAANSGHAEGHIICGVIGE
jgi:hypothetical protein